MLNWNLMRAVALGAFASIGLASVANADEYFASDATIDYSIPYSNASIVGYANQSDFDAKRNATSPTVSLVGGGDIGFYLSTYNLSVFNVSGGNVDDFLESYDNSTLNLYSGNVYSVIAQSRSIVNVFGGFVGSSINAESNSTINVSGGNINGFLVADTNSVINISGGNFFQDPTALLSGRLHFVGVGLRATLFNPTYDGIYSDYVLSGKLLDGSNVTGKHFDIENSTGATFTITNVPEPGPLALFIGMMSVGASFLIFRYYAMRRSPL